MANASSIQMNPDQFLDPRWRLSNLYWITDKDGKRLPFRPNDAQIELLGELHTLNVILKARQLGFTTLCCLVYLDACVFTPNTRAGVIAHRLDDAKVIFRDKIKFPYDNLDEGIRATVTAVQDSADTLTFSNNSSIRVSTSMRSGTLQYLHVSEFGKICALYPEKAREIVSGALNAVEAGQFIAIESTAEGQEGQFYEMAQKARAKAAARTPLTPLDFKFHFFPWWKDKNYKLENYDVPIGSEEEIYFAKLAIDGIHLTQAQKAWYVKKSDTLGADMKREYPSTPEESFEQALEGSYFSKELYVAAKHGRIGAYPYQPGVPVNTFWDLGRNDLNVIWLHQGYKGYNRFIGYYENSGEFIGHYVSWLNEWKRERSATFGDHYVPHDGDRESLWLEGGTKSVMNGLKFYPIIVQRPANKVEAIGTARTKLATTQFDEVGCDLGLKRLKAYRKEWDDERGVWKDRPRHDDASHGADGFLTFACSSYELPDVPEPERKRYRHGLKHGGTSWMAA